MGWAASHASVTVSPSGCGVRAVCCDAEHQFGSNKARTAFAFNRKRRAARKKKQLRALAQSRRTMRANLKRAAFSAKTLLGGRNVQARLTGSSFAVLVVADVRHVSDRCLHSECRRAATHVEAPTSAIGRWPHETCCASSASKATSPAPRSGCACTATELEDVVCPVCYNHARMAGNKG